MVLSKYKQEIAKLLYLTPEEFKHTQNDLRLVDQPNSFSRVQFSERSLFKSTVDFLKCFHVSYFL